MDDLLARLQRLEETGQELRTQAKDLEAWMRPMMTDPARLVRVELDEAGVPVRVRFTGQVREATPEQVESAVSQAVVSAVREHPRVPLDAAAAEELCRDIAENGLPQPRPVAGPDGRVTVEMLAGRPVRLLFARGFVAHRRPDEIARSVIDACTVALTGSLDRKEC
ncbi:MAG: hypothetical protein FWD18_10020 [Micrococcales bacterium]|nr:hypothetical protein [Micrococcales bacterium]